MKHIEVLIRPVLKKTSTTVVDAVTNSMANSIANGSERVHMIVRIHLLRGYKDTPMNEQVLIRGSLDYYEIVGHARRLQRRLRRYLVQAYTTSQRLSGFPADIRI